MGRLPIRWKSLFIVIGLMVFFIPICGFSQQDGFTIGDPSAGDIYLSLGMPEAVLIEKLKGFHVSPVPGSNTYGIAVKTKDNIGDLYKWIGSITFTDKKLTFISRTWYQSFNDGQTFDLADKLYHLFKQEMGERGELRVTIKTTSTRDPDKELKSIEIIAGNKKVSLLITDSEKKEYGRQVSIAEAISDKPFKN